MTRFTLRPELGRSQGECPVSDGRFGLWLSSMVELWPPELWFTTASWNIMEQKVKGGEWK